MSEDQEPDYEKMIENMIRQNPEQFEEQVLEPGETFRPIFMIGKCRIAKKTEPVPFSPFAPLVST